jgi:predicted RecA/RadA family phage recombinase
MSETRLSEGKLVTLEAVTAASNIAAGAMVGVSGTLLYTLSSATINVTATLGYSFVGILDEDISAGQSPVTVWAEGIFMLPVASGAADANLMPGYPVWSDGSGYVTTAGPEGDAAVGTIVGMSNATYGSTGGAAIYAYVRIRPMAFNWTIAATAALSATAPLPGSFPELAAR